MWQSFGGWFNSDPSWLSKYNGEKSSLVVESGLTESQLDKIVQLFVERDILRMN